MQTEKREEMQSRAMKEPWLIQRVKIKTYDSGKKGIDGYFDFEYMGSAEFEFGALPQALRAMRGNIKDYPDEPTRIKLADKSIAWYVGPQTDELLDYVRRFFEDQIDPNKLTFRLKERTRMHYRYAPQSDHDRSYAADAWWALDQEKPWLLFHKKQHAKEWIKRMKEKKV